VVEPRERLGIVRSCDGAAMMWLLSCVALQEIIDDSSSSKRVFVPLVELEDTDPDPDVFGVSIQATRQTHRIEDGDQVYEFAGYAYNGVMPGPLIRVPKGKRLVVDFENALDSETTIHWHGVKAKEDMDGVPWMRGPIEAGDSYTYIHDLEESGIFWYHPHFDTEHQVDRGLYGMLLVADPEQPQVDTEIALMLDDWPIGGVHEEHSHFYQEGVWTVNGVIEPEIEISGSTLLHMVNTSNHHYLDLGVENGVWVQNDQGMLSAPQERMVLAPGDRGSLLVEGETGRFAVHRYPFSAHGGASLGEEKPIFWLKNDTSASTVGWPFSEELPSEDVLRTDLVYVFHGDPNSDTWLINGESFPDITIESLPLGSEAIIELRNVSAVHHPFHVHGLIFEVLSIDGVPPEHKRMEDTIDMGIYQTIRIRVVADNPGDWMLHCHILPHGDSGMMTILRVE
jgi:FtsP/CotA-like multicopper oxidase with cupredoxin domain